MRRLLPLGRLPKPPNARQGLRADEAHAARLRHGPNDIAEVAGRPWLGLARDTASDPMIWFLLLTSGLYAVVGERVEAWTLLASTVPLLGMDVFLHWRTRASTEGLKSRLAERARLLRDGQETSVPALDVVPGDLAIVRAGEAFPADGILLDGSEMQVDESRLSGEAYPVRKQPIGDFAPDGEGPEPAVDGEHWGLAGTRLLTGEAKLRVVFTGGETLYGEIVRSALGDTHTRTPLQTAIDNLVALLVAAAAVVCLILAFVRLRQGYGWTDALVSALTLAVAALPEEFPVVFTFFLGVGVFRLARAQALVRRAVSVENIGRTSAICSDKTGTITEGRLTLTHLLPAPDADERELLRLAGAASRVSSGDPLDAAILSAAREHGAPAPGRAALATFPFTADRKRETVVLQASSGSLVAVTKGAPEVVLAMTSLGEDERAAWIGRAMELAQQGHKVIACAIRSLDGADWPGGEPDRGFLLAGLLALEDPVREGVAEAIAVCRNAGIRTIMVTGDHPATALAVAREIGLGGDAPRVVSADEIQIALDRGETDVLAGIDAIARAVPAQKLSLVQALKRAGEIVAVTGDGVNDVPALQAADVGIAMGGRGTRSAREVAAIVLLDDNFRTIVRAIREGRQLFRNLRLSFEFLLMVHIPLVVSAALVPLAGYPLLYLPIHIVWLELVIHPAALLSFQSLPQRGALEPPRRARPARFFNLRQWLVILTVGGFVTAFVVWGYLRSLGSTGNVEHGRAMALVALNLAIAALVAALSRLQTLAARLVSGGAVALSAVLVQVPVLARLLHVQPLHLDDWALALAGSLAAASLPLLAEQIHVWRLRRSTPAS
jgi:Ca2+-transporting ATPase